MSTTRGCRFKIIRSRTGAMRRRPFTNMKWPVTLILLVGLDILSQQKVSTCVVDQMTDTTFCRGSLQVSYTTIGMVNCVIIPKCFRTLLSTMLGQPSVLFPTADESKNYVLVMVDPDAPCQRNPKYRYWRHWLVTGISRMRHPPHHLALGSTATSSSFTSIQLLKQSPWTERKQDVPDCRRIRKEQNRSIPRLKP
ncbi:phosphatidylethanolamine-binding protein 4 isoform X5 [Heterodontus francisci]|uniref:phosphatidylethanolamine-binding protein 4 isoform X5 n=1 Tax=Heterodontus francisci TaxID=7792 RepID=UPI00355B03C4